MQVIQCIVENRLTLSSSVKIESKLLAREAIVVWVVAISYEPSTFHSFLVYLTNNSGDWITASGIVYRLRFG